MEVSCFEGRKLSGKECIKYRLYWEEERPVYMNNGLGAAWRITAEEVGLRQPWDCITAAGQRARLGMCYVRLVVGNIYNGRGEYKKQGGGVGRTWKAAGEMLQQLPPQRK